VLALVLLSAALAAAGPRTDAFGDPLPPGARARLGTTRFRSKAYIGAVALSADGKQVLLIGGGTANRQVSVLDVATGMEVRRFTLAAAASLGWAFSPDGRTLAVAHYSNNVAVHDTATGTLRRNLQRSGPSDSPALTLSADGRVLAMSSGGMGQQKVTVTAWDVDTGKRLATVALLQDSTGRSALSADGRMMATWGQHNGLNPVPRGAPDPQYGRVIQLWELPSGKELRRIKAERFVPLSAAFSPDGKHLAVLERGATLKLYEAATGKAVRRWAVPAAANSVRYSPDGKFLVAAGYNAVSVWDLATWRRLDSSSAPQATVQGFAFPGGGRVLACGARGEAVCIWDALTGRELTPRGGQMAVVSHLTFGRGGREVVTGAGDGLRWWDARTGRELRHLQILDEERTRFGHAMPGHGLTPIAFSPRGKYMVGSSRHGQRLRVVELATSREQLSLSPNDTPYAAFTVFSLDETALAVLGTGFDGRNWSGVVHVYDLVTGEEKKSVKYDLNTSGLALSPDGRKVALRTMEQRVAWAPVTAKVGVWDVASGKELTRVAGDPRPSPDEPAFFPDGSLLAVTGPGVGASLYNATTGAAWTALGGTAVAAAMHPTFSPDGRLLATVVMNQNPAAPQRWEYGLRVWELASGQVRCEFTLPGGIFAPAFAPDGRTLASAGDDTTALLWDLSGHDEAAAAGKPAARELDGLWADLAGDARTAHRALARLALSPAEAVALVRRRLPPAAGGAPPDPAKIAAWITELDSNAFEVRQRASKGLREAGVVARPVLQQALKAGPSAEKKHQLEGLLKVLQRTGRCRRWSGRSGRWSCWRGWGSRRHGGSSKNWPGASLAPR
jgi:WD40 repeat protein